MLLLRRKQALHSVASRLKRIGRWSKPCASCPIYIYPTRLSSITFGTTSASLGELDHSDHFFRDHGSCQDLVMFLRFLRFLLQDLMGCCVFSASVERGSYFPGDNLTRAPVLLFQKWEMALDALDRFTTGGSDGGSLMHLLGIVTLAVSAFSLHLGRSTNTADPLHPHTAFFFFVSFAHILQRIRVWQRKSSWKPNSRNIFRHLWAFDMILLFSFSDMRLIRLKIGVVILLRFRYVWFCDFDMILLYFAMIFNPVQRELRKLSVWKSYPHRIKTVPKYTKIISKPHILAANQSMKKW